MTAFAQLVFPLMLLLYGGRMLARPQSFVGTGRLDATDPRTVRKFGWFFLSFGVVGFGLALLHFAEG